MNTPIVAEIVPSDPFRDYALMGYRYWRDCYMELSDEDKQSMTLRDFLDKNWQNKDWCERNVRDAE